MKKIFQANPFVWKPQVWVSALLAAVVPVGAVVWKTSRSAQAEAAHAETVAARPAGNSPPQATQASTDRPASLGGIQEWFEGSANPFLTTAQAKDRRMKDALAKVESALKRRPDVEEVLILVDDAADKNAVAARKPKAVVSIRMRGGSLPIALADSAGSLVAAALPGASAEDVEVIDERVGTRVRARSLDAADSFMTREALEIAAACEQQEHQMEAAQTASIQPQGGAAVALSQEDPKKSPPPAVVNAVAAASRKTALEWIPWWAPPALIGVMGFISLSLGFIKSRAEKLGQLLLALPSNSPVSRPDILSEPLAFALHTGVAEKPALIAASLVERLESAPTSRQEVAALLLGLEPWAAERILSALPNRSLDLLEQSVKKPMAHVSSQHVRALAEAMICLRAAA